VLGTFFKRIYQKRERQGAIVGNCSKGRISGINVPANDKNHGFKHFLPMQNGAFV